MDEHDRRLLQQVAREVHAVRVLVLVLVVAAVLAAGLAYAAASG